MYSPGQAIQQEVDDTILAAQVFGDYIKHNYVMPELSAAHNPQLFIRYLTVNDSALSTVLVDTLPVRIGAVPHCYEANIVIHDPYYDVLGNR